MKIVSQYPTCIGIAGGSGSGKSTLAVALCKKYPDRCAVVHLDDYFVSTAEAPKLAGFTNWDHPDAIRFDDLLRDLQMLKNNLPIRVMTKSELYNPEYRAESKNKIEYTIAPKPIIILEGYLALHDPRIREMLDYKIYLDLSIEESAKRRSANKFALDPDYFSQILVPMHRQYVEPTRQYADLVVDVSYMNQEEVVSMVERDLIKLFTDNKTCTL